MNSAQDALMPAKRCYDAPMRTTLTLDDDLAMTLKEAAYREGTSFKAIVNEALRTGLAHLSSSSRARPYRLEPASLGGVKPGIDLDRALRLADALEDESIARKLELRK